MATKSEQSSGVEPRAYHRYQDSVFEKLSNRWVLASITVLPVILLLALVQLLPIVWAIYSGFFAIPALNPDWTWVGVENYVNILSDGSFWASLWRSVVFGIGTTIVTIILGTLLALLVNRKIKFPTLTRAIIFLPYLIPSAVLAFIALWMGNSSWGIVSDILIRLGFIDQPIPFFGLPKYAMGSLIATNSWKYTIFTTILVLARLQSIDDGFYEAATVAGATTYQKFRDITFPNIKGVLFIVFLLRGVWMFNKFDVIYVLTQGGPGDATTTAAIYAYNTAFQFSQLGRAAAVSTALFVIIGLAAIVYFYVFEPEQEVRVE